MDFSSPSVTRDPAKAKDEMENIQKDLRLAVGEVRRFMYDLRPPALAQQGVGAAVESHCQRLAHRFGIDIVVDWRSSAVLPPSHDTAMFRIVQEALQNIVKHAQATRVDVRSADTEGALEVTVSVNGKGFETDRIRRLDPKHFGLAGMRARAQQIGATLDVSSTAGQRGEARHSAYAASKGALISYTKSLAVELGPRGVRVNCVAPGWVETDLTRDALSDPAERLRIEQSIPLGRIGSAEDAAGPVLFLVSDLARHVQGEVVNVNGGSVLVG
jgi:3-oxoacyl-[acyl-carrier protein] reductase